MIVITCFTNEFSLFKEIDNFYWYNLKKLTTFTDTTINHAVVQVVSSHRALKKQQK